MSEASGTSAHPLESLRYVVVEGPIGVGKSTLARMLAERFRGRGLRAKMAP